MFKRLSLCVLLLLFGLQHALAHDAWLQRKGTELTVAYGHGEKLDSYDPDKVKEVRAFDCNGGSVALKTTKQQDGVSLSPERSVAAVTVLFDGGYGVKTTDGWKRITKREAQGKFTVVESLKSRKYAKALLKPCENAVKPVGLHFEIVPESDPCVAKGGEKLSLKVFLEGRPVEGAVLKCITEGAADPEKLPETGKDGKASITIARPGAHLITASYKTPLKNDPDADVLSLGTSLTFEVP